MVWVISKTTLLFSLISQLLLWLRITECTHIIVYLNRSQTTASVIFTKPPVQTYQQAGIVIFYFNVKTDLKCSIAILRAAMEYFRWIGADLNQEENRACLGNQYFANWIALSETWEDVFRSNLVENCPHFLHPPPLPYPLLNPDCWEDRTSPDEDCASIKFNATASKWESQLHKFTTSSRDRGRRLVWTPPVVSCAFAEKVL